MNKKLKWTLIVLGVLGALFLISKIFGGNDKIEKVAIEKAAKRTIIETVNASGKIYPEVEVKISPDISGEITELNVEEGDSVKRGQVLARIYADIYALQRDEAASRVNQSAATVDNSQAALEALKANLELAQQSYNRNKKLFDDKVISKAELEQFETTLKSAQANYTAAQQNIKGLKANVQSTQVGLSKANKDLSRTTLVAPMDGVNKPLIGESPLNAQLSSLIEIILAAVFETNENKSNASSSRSCLLKITINPPSFLARVT